MVDELGDLLELDDEEEEEGLSIAVNEVLEKVHKKRPWRICG